MCTIADGPECRYDAATARGRNARGARRLAFASLLLAQMAAAADHVVYFADAFPPQHIVPVDLTIAAGDTVTFKSIGNNEFHNAHADDDSFRCAIGCRGDGSGATGDPARKDWADTLTFTTPGVIHYHCDEHPGATASITVVAGQPIAGGISGNWYDPTANQGGHGFQIEVLPNNGLLAIWFVFKPDGSAQNWIYAQGSYDPGASSATLPAFLEQGGAFPPDFDSSKLSVTPWGSLTFTFTDCSTGTVAWNGNDSSHAAGYGDVTFPISHLTTIAGTSCP